MTPIKLSMIVSLGLLMTACAAPPRDRLQAVSAALDDARQQDVDRWAPLALAETVSLIEAAEEEIGQQEARRFSLRSFRVARLLLDDAERSIASARAVANQAAADASGRADDKLREAFAALARVRSLRKNMPKRPDTADDRAGIDADLEALARELNHAQERFGSGAFLEAADTADRVAARGQHMADMVARTLDHHALPAAQATF